ncbi:MAG: hypothetical protein QXK88_03845 [Desulfurococcaceae archaeon]
MEQDTETYAFTRNEICGAFYGKYLETLEVVDRIEQAIEGYDAGLNSLKATYLVTNGNLIFIDKGPADDGEISAEWFVTSLSHKDWDNLEADILLGLLKEMKKLSDFYSMVLGECRRKYNAT